MGAKQSCHKACSNCAADCARPIQGYDEDGTDERPCGDPAGAIFDETLEDLNNLDRQLMLFCATSNLVAVRWLIHMGAMWNACDANGTTCLHVACRAGAIAIVKEMLKHKDLLEIPDVAGWSPLHVAVLMGRREVVVLLLAAGAPLNCLNNKHQMPAELCADSGTFEALRDFERAKAQGALWDPGLYLSGASEDVQGVRLQYEPFFVPRQPVIRTQQYRKEFQKIGTAMFNTQPGYGLGFLVASGVTRDYPVDLSTFLRRGRVDHRQVGSFLGEAYSLSHTIRLELINSVVLHGTGVVGALTEVFRMMAIPEDLQKINRLVHGVARIWWRQHDRIQKSLAGNVIPPANSNKKSDEFAGLELLQYITSMDVLYQLMFSTVLLHWFTYKDGSGPRQELDLSSWKQLNAGIEEGGASVPGEIQEQIYALLRKQFIPELALLSGQSTGRGSQDTTNGTTSASDKKVSLLAPVAALEGWVQFVGGTFPKPTGLTGTQAVNYQHMASIFAEDPASGGSMGLMKSGATFVGSFGLQQRADGSARMEAYTAGPRKDDFAWLGLCYTLLFFSCSSTQCAPYAFVELSKLALYSVEPDVRIMTLVGAPDGEDGEKGEVVAEVAVPPSKPRPRSQVAIILLLPDGRWQEIFIEKLQMRVSSSSELDQWVTQLSAATQSKSFDNQLTNI